MKIAYFTDSHLDSSNYQDVLPRIEEVFLYGDVVVCGGDLFNSPFASVRVVAGLVSIIQKYQKPFYVVPGNHDLRGRNIDKIGETALGLLGSTSFVEILTDKICFDDACIYGVPYTDTPLNTLTVDNDAFSIVVAHLGIFPHRTPFTQLLVDDIRTNADIVLCGHIHNPAWEVQKGGTRFVNPGSINKTSVLDKRESVNILLFNTQTKNLDRVAISLPQQERITTVEQRSFDFEIKELSQDVLIKNLIEKAPEEIESYLMSKIKKFGG